MAGKQNAARKEREKKPDSAGIAAVGAAIGAPKLDRLIHERLRLGILSALSVNESLTFNELKKLLDTTDGNLSVHARKLEEAGYLTCTKIVRRAGAAERLQAERRRPARARALPRSHGSAHPGDAREIATDGSETHAFLCLYDFKFKVLCIAGSSWMATAAGRSARGLPRIAGHRAGVETVRRVVEAAPDAGVGMLTLFAFSSDNWRRPPAEVDALMRMHGGVPGRGDRRLRRTGRAAGSHRPPRPAGARRSARRSRAPKRPPPAERGSGCGSRWTTRRATPSWQPPAALKELSLRSAGERARARRSTC